MPYVDYSSQNQPDVLHEQVILTPSIQYGGGDESERTYITPDPNTREIVYNRRVSVEGPLPGSSPLSGSSDEEGATKEDRPSLTSPTPAPRQINAAKVIRQMFVRVQSVKDSEEVASKNVDVKNFEELQEGKRPNEDGKGKNKAGQ